MNDDIHALSGAYALHALPDAEVTRFERHMRGCAGCGAEVRTLRETAARLALTVAEPPPATLRPRLFATIRRVRHQPPAGYPRVTGDAAVMRPPGRAVQDDATVVYAREAAGPVDVPAVRVVPEMPEMSEVQEMPEIGAVPVAGASSRARGRARVAAGLAAVCAAAAVVLGVVAFDARRDLGDLRARDREVAAVLAAPDARTVRQPITSGGTGTLVLSRERGRIVFTGSGLPELAGTRVYELWLMGRDGPRPAALLGGGDGGLMGPVVARTTGQDARLGLTVEPAGGSSHPTTLPVMLADLPST